MTSLLESPAFRERVHRLSVEGYHRAGETGVLSEGVELLRGIVVTKMPKSPLHGLVGQKLMNGGTLRCASITGVEFHVAEILPSR